MKHFTGKVLSLLLSIMMVTSSLSVSAFADNTAEENQSKKTVEVQTDDFALASEQDLYNPVEINNLTQINDLSGDYKLISNVTINASNWTPIGTEQAPFTGTLDGNGKTITWTGTAAGTSTDRTGYGLFGYSDGVIANLTVTGSITVEGTGSYLGSVAGYSSGSIYQCISDVNINADNMSNVGGIAGALESVSVSQRARAIMISGCGNTGDISGSSRVGGVVGAVYCNNADNAVIDHCYSRDCVVCVTSSRKAYGGGLAGYVKGTLINDYVDNVSLYSTNGGHYIGGLAGLLNGYSTPYAKVENCYTAITSYGSDEDGTKCDVGFTYPVAGSVDGTSNVKLNHCYWTEVDSYIQPYNDGTTWGNWINSASLSGNWNIVTDYQGTPFEASTSRVHPVLIEEPVGSGFDVTTGVKGSDTALAVHLGGSGEGAYTTLADAIDAAGSGGRILVDGTTSITSALESHANVTIERGENFNGTLFILAAGNDTVILTSMIIDAESNGQATGTIFDIQSGNVYLRGGITLKNAANAVTMRGGILELRNAEITACGSTSENGGAVNIINGAVNMYRGTVIHNCTAAEGGAVYVASNATFVMNDGSITGCSAVNGGAVAIRGGSFSLNGGTISQNAATGEGAGIYDAGIFTLNASNSTTLSDRVYLAGSSNIRCGSSLDSLNGSVSVKKETLAVNDQIAVSVNSQTDADKIEYYDHSCDLDYNEADGYVYVSSLNNFTQSEGLDLLAEIDWSVAHSFTSNVTIPSGTVITAQQQIVGSSDPENPVVITIDGTVYTKFGTNPFPIQGGYVKFAGINNATLLATDDSPTMQFYIALMKEGSLEISGVTIDGRQKARFMIAENNGKGHREIILNGGTKITGSVVMLDEAASAAGITLYDGKLTVDDAEISNCEGGTILGSIGDAVRGRNGSVVVKSGTVSSYGDGTNNAVSLTIKTDGDAADMKIEPTGAVDIDGTAAVNGVTLTPQSGYSIESYKLVETNGTEVTEIPTAETALGTEFKSLNLTVQEAQETESYNAYLTNVSAEEIAKDGTFTADVCVKSDSPIDAAQIDLTVQNGTITSIEPAADGIESGNGSISVYNNTADVKDGYKLATVTVKADGTKNDVVLSIADTSTVGISGSPEDYSFTLGDDAQATVSIYKSDKVSCEEYAAGKYLLKYTGEVADGNIAQYNGEDLLYSEKLGAWIAVIDTDVSESVVNNDITTAAGTKESVDYTGDVNLNGIVNIVDAQIAYDIANNVYSDYSIATKPMWFRADANGDGTVKAPDARAIQCLIHGIIA